MAEVFGVIVSALTVAEMAGKFGTSIVKLKKLWDEVQDVPNEINQLFRQLELLRPVLSEMEAEFTQQTHKIYHNSAANLSMEYCQQAVAELDTLAEELQAQINAARRARRNITKLKVSFKKDSIRRFQERIQFALQLLSLSQQTYIIAVVKSRPPALVDQSTQSSSTQLNATQQTVQSGNILRKASARDNVLPGGSRKLPTIPMTRRRASFFGGFIYQTVSDPNHPGTEVHQARVQLPWWISDTIWDFQAHRAYTGWKFLLKPWITRPDDARIFELIRVGSWTDILEAFARNEASLQDVNPSGWTLLHESLFWGQFDITKHLVAMGLSLNDTGTSDVTPLEKMYLDFPDIDSSLCLLQYLLDTGELDDDIEHCFIYGDTYELSSNLPDFMWKVPGALGMMVRRGSTTLKLYHQLPPESRFNYLDWFFVDPEILLDDICKSGNLEPAAFRVVLDVSPLSSLHGFASQYFRDLGYDIRNCLKEKHGGYSAYKEHEKRKSLCKWREIARWIFRGLSVEDLSRHGPEEFGLFGTTAIFTALIGLDYMYLKPRQLSRLLLNWLEDVQSSGMDLVKYGRRELELYLANEPLRLRRWLHTRVYPYGRYIFDWSKRAASGPRLMSFTYGPEPQDWKLIWDLDAEEYAGEFWERVENPPLHLPGGWVEDED